MMKRHVVPFVCGLMFAGMLQVAMGWWLNSGPGVVATLVALFGVALVFARDERQAIALWVGVMTGMIVVLATLGGGTIWPIVIAVAGILTGVTVLLAWASRRVLRRRSP